MFKSDWSNKTDQLGVIKTEAVDLQQLNGSALRNDSLTRYLSYIGDYNAAISFVSNLTCSSKSKYDQLVAQKEVYKKKYPLSNNSNLVAQLNGVPGKAKSKWESSVLMSVRNACIKINLDDFLSEKRDCESKISEYNNYFSSDKLSTTETTTKLRNRWYELLEDAVNEACQIDNLSSFSNVYSDLRNKIDAYGSDPSDLKGRLSRKYNQLRGY